LLDALVDQTAVAIERVHLVDDMDRAQRSIEAERLRSALLTSLSHDLKTPLAAVIGTAATMRDLDDKLTKPEKVELLTTIVEEGERLNRFIANLLDMTRLESGAVALRPSLQDVGEIVGGALRRTSKMLEHHRIELGLEADLPMVQVDPVLFEQVLFNLLDNAAKYAPTDTTIRITGRRDGDQVVLQIADEGQGIPPGDIEHIFDKFYRVNKGDRVRAGTGLGLAISRGFIEAMQGTITAANRADRSGALFTIRLPIPPQGGRLDIVS
jgi:two-component system sensor histidine kinase KdpD